MNSFYQRAKLHIFIVICVILAKKSHNMLIIVS